MKQKNGWAVPYDYAKAFVLVMGMILCSVIFHDKEVVLPEFAALSIGCIVYRNPEWTKHPFHLFLIPFLTAVTGFGINMLPVPLVLKVMFAAAAVFVVMRTFSAYLAPALATGLLPVITNTTSWVYLLSIFLLMAVLALIIKLAFPSQKGGEVHEHNMRGFRAYFFFLMLWLAIYHLSGHMEIAAIPPVVVVGFEMMHKKKYAGKTLIEQIVVLSLSSFVGACSLYYIPGILLAVVIDFLVVFLILQVMKVKLPPAYAISILPIILHVSYPWIFAMSVFVMSTVMLGLVYIWKQYGERRFYIFYGRSFVPAVRKVAGYKN